MAQKIRNRFRNRLGVIGRRAYKVIDPRGFMGQPVGAVIHPPGGMAKIAMQQKRLEEVPVLEDTGKAKVVKDQPKVDVYVGDDKVAEVKAEEPVRRPRKRNQLPETKDDGQPEAD